MPWRDYAQAGNRLWEEGDEEGAILKWEKAVELGFADGFALFYLGRHYAHRKDWKKVIRYLSPARPRLENSRAEEGMILAAAELLALAYLREGRYLESYLLYLQALRLAPDAPSLHLGLAELYLHQGKLNDAERSARRVLELSPGDGKAARILARIAMKRGDYPEAEEYFRIYLAEEPKDWNARLARGMILAVHLGRDREAERELEIVVREKPDQDQAHAVRGEIYFRRGELAAADEAARRALEINPENYTALTRRGRLRLEAGDPDGAEMFYREALRVKPEGALALYEMGVIIFQRGDYGEAESYFSRALARRAVFPEAALNRGLSLAALGRREEAFLVLRELVEKHPEFAPGHLELGRAYLNSGRLDQAEPFLRNALALDPSNWEPYYYIGRCLWERGYRGESLDYYLAARGRGGDTPRLLTALALAYEETGEFDLAESTLEKVLAKDSHYLPALLQDQLFRQALVIRPGKVDWGFPGEGRDFLFQLVSVIEDFLEGGIDYLSLYALIRNLSRERTILTDLIPVLREKVSAYPSQPQYAHLLGLALEEKGEDDEAERYFQRALRLDPDFAAAHISLGHLYTRLGRDVEARRHISAALLLVPPSSVTPEIRWLLESLSE